MINILIRLHTNIDKFYTTLETINNQTYKNFNIIVSVDNYTVYQHMLKNNLQCRFIYIDPVGLYPGQRNNQEDRRAKTRNKKIFGNLFIPNIYFNILHQYIQFGYIFYLDVGDTILDSDMFMNLKQYMDNKSIIVWKIISKSKRRDVIPHAWDGSPIVCDIDSSSFMFPSDYIENWTGYRKGDFRVAQKICTKNKTIFIPNIYIKKDM